jgi:O-methyltransferase
MNPQVAKFVKEAQFNSPLRRYFFPRYAYNFTPPQLSFLCQCIEETRNLTGGIAEVGCFDGSATVFLNKYMDAKGIEKDYVAVDTFCGFVAEDIRVEVDQRGKSRTMFNGFQSNKKKWFDGTMRQNGITRVRSIQADVNEFDLKSLGPLSFCLLDVDLYRPIKKSLGELYEILVQGGIMVVDDCDATVELWDGADQAYKEFMAERHQPILIVHNKLGQIRKSLS